MENVLLVYLTVFGIVIGVLAIYALRSDESLSRKWAKVRVRTDESRRRHIPEPQDEEFDSQVPAGGLLMIALFLLLLVLINGA